MKHMKPARLPMQRIEKGMTRCFKSIFIGGGIGFFCSLRQKTNPASKLILERQALFETVSALNLKNIRLQNLLGMYI